MNLLAACVWMFTTFYGEPQNTASGEWFDGKAWTAAHKTLPLGTYIFVTNPRNNRTILLRINDRGPFKKRKGEPIRELDISIEAAKLLHWPGKGWLCVQRL